MLVDFKTIFFCFGVCFGKWFSLHNKPAIQLYRKHSTINVNDTYAYMHIHTHSYHRTCEHNIYTVEQTHLNIYNDEKELN